MFVLILIPLALIGYLLVTWWHFRRRDDLIREREQAFATLRQMVECPPVQTTGLTERVPILSDHVRILSERPADMPRSRRPAVTRNAYNAASRRRTTNKRPPQVAIPPTLPSSTSLVRERDPAERASPSG